MRTNATLISITRAGGGPTDARSVRCLFTGTTLADQGGSASKLTGTLLIPHHELVRDTDAAPHAHPKIGDTIQLRLDGPVGEFGDDISYTIETARGVPGGALRHWHYTLK
jgi:hypothetical protein